MSPLEAHYRNQLRSGGAFSSSVLDAIEMRFLRELEEAVIAQEKRSKTEEPRQGEMFE